MPKVYEEHQPHDANEQLYLPFSLAVPTVIIYDRYPDQCHLVCYVLPGLCSTMLVGVSSPV